MNTSDFDLDITHWNVEELEKLFQLPEQYDYNLLLEKKSILQTNLGYDNNIDLKNRENLISFLNKAVNKIVSVKKKDIITEMDQKNLIMRYDDIKNDIYENNDKFIIKGENTKTPFTQSSTQQQLHSMQNNKASLINPISHPDLNYTVNIDSCFRSNYDNTKSTDFIIDMPSTINNVISMELDMVELPLTYYAISECLGNNKFSITYNDTQIDIRIADGNYESKNSIVKNAKIIEDEINHALLACDISLVYTVDKTSGRSIFARVDDTTINFTIDFTSRVIKDEIALQLTLGWLMGFRTASYTCQDTLVSEGICNIRGPRYAFICIDDYQNNVLNNFICPYESSLVNKNIITRLNLETVAQSETIYKSGEIRGLARGVMSRRDYFGPVNLQRLHIELVDEYGRIIDLNYMDMSFILTFKCLYEY
jgi:hypothetical protein